MAATRGVRVDIGPYGPSTLAGDGVNAVHEFRRQCPGVRPGSAALAASGFDLAARVRSCEAQPAANLASPPRWVKLPA